MNDNERKERIINVLTSMRWGKERISGALYRFSTIIGINEDGEPKKLMCLITHPNNQLQITWGVVVETYYKTVGNVNGFPFTITKGGVTIINFDEAFELSSNADKETLLYNLDLFT